MIRYWYTALFSLISIITYGQVSQDTAHLNDTKRGTIVNFIIKNGTTSLIDPIIPSLNVGFEKVFAKQNSFYVEAGPALKFRYFTVDPTFVKLRGYRIRAALRRYFKPPVFGETNFYVELYGSYYQLNATIEGDFWRETNIGNFTQRFNYDMDRNRLGTYFNIGFQPVDVNGLAIEVGGGLGALRRTDKYSGVPADASFRTNGSNIFHYEANPDEPAWIGTLFFYLNIGLAK